jgi:pilus assembly protein Flp/PilA
MKLSKLYLSARNFVKEESGQDLVEYALVVALIAFAAVLGMGTVANGINSAFSTIASRLTSAMA